MRNLESDRYDLGNSESRFRKAAASSIEYELKYLFPILEDINQLGVDAVFKDSDWHSLNLISKALRKAREIIEDYVDYDD